MNKNWVISDHHFGHTNVIKYCNRPFTNTRDMNNEMISNHNHLVRKSDKVFILGDFSLTTAVETVDILSKLNGYLILLMGNHDRGRSYKRWMDMGFDEVYKYPILYKENIILSHNPIIVSSGYYNIHGHLHNTPTEYDKSDVHYNVSVEKLDYKPVDLDKLIDKILGL